MTANTAHQANRLTVLVQILTIVIAVVLSGLFLTLTDPLSLEKSNLALRQQLEGQQTAVTIERSASQSVRRENDSLRGDIARLRAEVEQLRSKPRTR